MVQELIRGQKLVVGKINESFHVFTLTLSHPNVFYAQINMDVFAFMIQKNGQVHKEDIIFYNHPVSSCDAIQYNVWYGEEKYKNTLEVYLHKIPKNIEKIAFVCSVYKDNSTEHQPMNWTCHIDHKQVQTEAFVITGQLDTANHKTVLLGDLYQYKDTWKFNVENYSNNEHLLTFMRKFYNLKIC